MTSISDTTLEGRIGFCEPVVMELQKQEKKGQKEERVRTREEEKRGKAIFSLLSGGESTAVLRKKGGEENRDLKTV